MQAAGGHTVGQRVVTGERGELLPQGSDSARERRLDAGCQRQPVRIVMGVLHDLAAIGHLLPGRQRSLAGGFVEGAKAIGVRRIDSGKSGYLVHISVVNFLENTTTNLFKGSKAG